METMQLNFLSFINGVDLFFSAADCPADSTYYSFGTACPPTCADPTPGTCGAPNQEVCLCNDGMVFNDDNVCVELSNCGCIDDNGNERAVSSTVPFMSH